MAGDGAGRPLAVLLTGGNRNDSHPAIGLLDAIRVPRLGPGPARTRPDHVLGDKGSSTRAIRAELRRRRIPHTIPERRDQRANRRRKGRRVADRRWLTGSATSAATSSSAASTGSSSIVGGHPV